MMLGILLEAKCDSKPLSSDSMLTSGAPKSCEGVYLTPKRLSKKRATSFFRVSTKQPFRSSPIFLKEVETQPGSSIGLVTLFLSSSS